MTKHSKEDPTFLLYEAIASPHGVKVYVNRRYHLEQRLRKIQAVDPALSELSFRTSPFSQSELWIVKRKL